jgi:hypothetical protein
MVLIDTPGLNATFEDHALSTAGILSRVDLFVLVTAYLHAGNAGEIAFLQRLARPVDLLVINRIDAADIDEGPINQHLEQMARKYGDLIGEYVGVSARDAINARERSDISLYSESRWEDFVQTFDRVLHSRARERQNANALRQLREALHETSSRIASIADETESTLSEEHVLQGVARECRSAALFRFKTWKLESQNPWTPDSITFAALPNPLRSIFQQLVFKMSELSSDLDDNRAESRSCDSSRLRLDDILKEIEREKANYKKGGWFSRTFDQVFEGTWDKLGSREANARREIGDNAELKITLNVESVSLVQQRDELAKEGASIAQQIFYALRDEYLAANLSLIQSRARLRKIRWDFAIHPELFEALCSAYEPLTLIDSAVVDDLDLAWNVREGTGEVACVVEEVGKLKNELTRLNIHNPGTNAPWLSRLRRALAQMVSEFRTDKALTVLSGIDEALTYIPPLELSKAIRLASSGSTVDRFAVALSCWAVGDVASYEYLAQTVRSRVGLDKVFSFATKHAPIGHNEFLHCIAITRPKLSREVYLRSDRGTRACLVSVTNIALDILNYLARDQRMTKGTEA